MTDFTDFFVKDPTVDPNVELKGQCTTWLVHATVSRAFRLGTVARYVRNEFKMTSALPFRIASLPAKARFAATHARAVAACGKSNPAATI